jgi:hypothetical protein
MPVVHTIIINRPDTFGFNVKWSKRTKNGETLYTVSCPGFGATFTIAVPDSFGEFRDYLVEEMNVSVETTRVIYDRIITEKEGVVTLDGMTGKVV